MKSIFKTMAMLVTLLMVVTSNAMAFDSGANSNVINIDGMFADWQDKPYIEDPKHDIKSPWLDFLTVKYIADDKYLYVYVERLSAKKSEPWDFNVVILNGVKGRKELHYPFGPDKPIYAPKFSITSENINNSSSNGTLINVFFDGQKLESTFSADDNSKTIEFRLPLDKVGLSGQNKEIKFMVKSQPDEKQDEVDWVPDGRPIIVTTGPTLWQLSSAILFILAAAAAYGVYRGRKPLLFRKAK